MSENEIRNACAEFLLYNHWLVIRPNMGIATPEREDGSRGWVPFNRWQILGDFEHTDGISDLLAFKWGLPPLAIECKVPGNEPTPAQLRFMAAWVAAGGRAVVAHGIGDLAGVVGEK